MNFVARAKISFKFNESSLFFNRKVIIKIDPHHHHQKYPARRVRYNRWKWGNTLYRRGSKQKRKIENRRCVVRLGRGFREYGAFVAVEIFESDVSFDVPTLPSPSSLPPRASSQRNIFPVSSSTFPLFHHLTNVHLPPRFFPSFSKSWTAWNWRGRHEQYLKNTGCVTDWPVSIQGHRGDGSTPLHDFRFDFPSSLSFLRRNSRKLSR